MYIDKIEITNIRAIEHFTMTFKQHAGWHVLIGDNGAGKSTIIRSLALAMLNVEDIFAARLDWNDWLKKGREEGIITVGIVPNEKYESTKTDVINKITLGSSVNFDSSKEHILVNVPPSLIEVIYRNKKTYTTMLPLIPDNIAQKILQYSKSITNDIGAVSQNSAWFSVAYGPFRRFSGGNSEKESLFQTNPKLGAHLTAFGEDVALTEALAFIRELYIQKIDRKSSGKELAGIERFVNNSNLLQPGVIIEKIDSTGVFFRDANGNTVPATQLSDGYRSILSLTFEMFHEMIRLFGEEEVFKNVSQGEMTIDVPGVVLIDEADAHLHPTWQTRIGQWFVEHFPNIQFIVTTHSPLICRACEKGSIWRLAAPGSDEESGEITGVQRDRLIYGNVLEAYGTEAFGENVSQSQEGIDMGERLAHLNMRSFQGLLTENERTELFGLKAKLPTAG